MKEEISAAVLFLTRLVEKNKDLTEEQIQAFSKSLNSILMEKFQGHWFPEKPCKGQGYRCIRVNETERYDPILQEAAQQCGLKYNDLKLPPEFTVWVDPHEVCCRFGEHKGSYCTVASFKNGNKENFIDKMDELEQKTAEILKKAAVQDMLKRKKTSRKHSSQRKNGYNQNFPHQNILQQLPTLPSNQNFQTSLFPPPHPVFHRGPSPSPFFNYNNLSPSLAPFYSSHIHGNGSRSPKFPSRGYNNQMHTTNGGISHNSARYSSNRSLKNDRYHWVSKKSEKKE